MSQFESLSTLSQMISFTLFFSFFLAVLVYALWPRNRSSFEDAASIPFKED